MTELAESVGVLDNPPTLGVRATNLGYYLAGGLFGAIPFIALLVGDS